MLFIMVGEDETEGLQEREDDLANLDAELDAVEQGGTGQVASFDDSYGYNYEDSSELTDVDEQPGYDDSEDFTDFGDDDAYSVTGDDDEEADNEDFDGDDDDYDGDGGDFDGDDDDDDEDDNSDDDDDENEDDEEDAEDEDKKKDGEENEDGNSKNEDGGDGKGKKGDNNQNQKGKNKKPKIDPYDGVIKWRPGQPITIQLLDQVWNKGVSKIKKVKSYVDAANNAVSTAINTMGPNLMLKLNKYINEASDSDTDTIGSLLKLVASNGKRLLYTTLATVEALFDQQWNQVLLLAGLPAAFLYATADPTVKSILTAIFTIAVPIINRNARKEDKNKKE